MFLGSLPVLKGGGVLVVDSGGIYALLKHIILPGLYLVEENNLGITSCKGELLTRISF
jgi:hypothetical protein